ncbi:MAG: hypothetical protein LBQ88_08260 [Treponema sp.]|jgi:hypothetical protein|nr:hypothetical protein [Treponema sp.]
MSFWNTPQTEGKPQYRIGTEKESSLHRSLKFRYAGEGGQTEIEKDGYVCDGLTENGCLIEVQTGSFGPLKEKARNLAAGAPIIIIHPIVLSKEIELYSNEGELLYRRKSPRKGGIYDLFKNLIYAPELPLVTGLTIELALVDISEKRIQDGRGSWRRKGVSIADKSLLFYHNSIPLLSSRDYAIFLPYTEKDTFTVRDLSKKARINENLARKCLYVLCKLGLTVKTEKKGNAWVYTILNRP